MNWKKQTLERILKTRISMKGPENIVFLSVNKNSDKSSKLFLSKKN